MSASPSGSRVGATPGRRRRLVRAAGWAGWLTVGVVVVLGLCELSGWPFLRGPLERQLASRLAVPVRVEAPFRLQLLRVHPSVSAGRLFVGAGGGLDLPHLVDAHTLRLAWRWGDLRRALRGEGLRVESLSAASLDARIVRDAQGRASWHLGPARDRRPAGSDESQALPRFGQLSVADGVIAIDDPPSRTQLDLRIEGTEGRTTGTSGTGTAPGVGEAGAAGWRGRVVGRWRDLPLELDLAAGAALPLVSEHAEAARVPLRIAGRAGAAAVDFDGRVGALLGPARAIDGALRIAGPSLAPVGRPFGVTLPNTPAFELAGRIAHGSGVWRLVAERAGIGASRLHGDFRFDTRESPPRLTGRVAGPRLSLADLGPAVGTAPAAQSQAAAPAGARQADRLARQALPEALPAPRRAGPGRVLPDRRFDLPSLRFMNADVAFALETLDFGSAAVAPASPARARVQLESGVLTVAELSAGIGGGRIGGFTQLDANVQPARWRADLRFDDVDLARWLPVVRRAPGPDGRRPAPWVSGHLDGRVRVAGAGQSTAQIVGSLDGEARLALREGQLSHLITEAAGLDLAQALGVWVRGDQPLPLRCARLDLAIDDGIARPRVALLDNRDSTLRIAGELNLREETLGLVARSRPKDFSPLALRAPITVRGRWSDPQVGVEGGRIAGKLLGAAALGAALGPLAAFLPLIDTGSGEDADPCARPEAAAGGGSAQGSGTAAQPPPR